MKTIGLLSRFASLIRLCWRLFRDSRVPIWPKTLLVAAVAYVALPFDIIPDMIPFLGQLDDVVIVVTAARWFVRWCPTAVVDEHMRAIGSKRLG